MLQGQDLSCNSQPGSSEPFTNPKEYFLFESLVLEKKIFEGFLPYMGVVAILVM